MFYVGGLMVDYRSVIEGSRYATIFDRMDGGRGLMAAAQSFVSKAIEEIDNIENKQLSADEQADAVEPMVGTPITMVMSSVTAMEDVEDVVVEMPDYDKNSEDLNYEIKKFLEDLGVYGSIKMDMAQNLKEYLTEGWIEEGMSNTEQLELKQEINEMVNKLGDSPEFENYVGHCIMSTLAVLAKEQLEDMGGIEDAMAEDPEPMQDVTGDFEILDAPEWQDKMREFKSMSWKNIMRK